MNAQISFDLVMEQDMNFVEGTFRLGDGPWQILIFRKEPRDHPVVSRQRWESGASGVVISVPEQLKLQRQMVVQLLSTEFGVRNWQEVEGPDSMSLR